MMLWKSAGCLITQQGAGLLLSSLTPADVNGTETYTHTNTHTEAIPKVGDPAKVANPKGLVCCIVCVLLLWQSAG